jgi:hypothetical protein
VRGLFSAEGAELLQFELGGRILFVLLRSVIAAFALAARQQDIHAHALLRDLGNDARADGPAAFADGEAQPKLHGDRAIISTMKVALSPGMTISTPSASVTTPVTSVVRK